MISTYLAMQNAIFTNNMATLGMMSASDRMLGQVSALNSQPLKPSFSAAANANELSMKANETKAAVSQKLADAISECLGKNIKNSTPKYSGLDYKA